jgi:Protein of unknown function (DUF3040)
MNLPAWQQRVLDRMESALQASEPHLVSMFAIFARLNAGEPVGEEPRARARPRRRRWSPSGAAFYAVVFIPIMFAMLLAALLGGSPSSAETRGAGYSASGGSLPLVSQASCLAAEKTVSQKKASAPAYGSCAATELDARPAAWTGSALAFFPPAQTSTVAGDSAKTC